MSSTEDKAEAAGTVAAPSLTDDLKTFLMECEKDFGKRYTEEEEEFSAHFQKDPSPPPIVYPWYRSQQNYRHSRGHNSRNYEQRDRHGDRSRHDDRDRSRHDRRDHYERRDHHNHGEHWRRNNDGGSKGYHNRHRPY